MFVCPECGRPYRDGGFCGEDGAVLVEPADPLLGTMVQRYQLARVLGAGGMGRVYLGVQPDIGSRVAIKVLSEDCARDPGLVERFFSEARAVNLIRHEHIVGVLDLARFPDGRPYIVMEHVDGITLGAMARQQMLPLGPLCALIDEVLSALAAAHAIGIVHRDLKPDNVMVTRAGHAKVLDFGIAKLAPSVTHAPSPRTRTGALLGTPEYMAPEQVSGKNVDGRTDLYAAGIMLYETTTGRRPFHGENLFDLLRSHLEDTAVPPRQLRPELPELLEAVIVRALAKAPEARYQTAAEMMDALAKAASALPQSAWAPLPHAAPTPISGRTPQQRGSRPGRPVTDAPRMSRAPATEPTADTRRSRLPLFVGGAVVLVLAGIGAGALVGAKRKDEGQQLAVSGSGSGSGSASGSALNASPDPSPSPSPSPSPISDQGSGSGSGSAPQESRTRPLERAQPAPGGPGPTTTTTTPKSSDPPRGATSTTPSSTPASTPAPPAAGSGVTMTGTVTTSGNVGTTPNGSHVIFQKKSQHFEAATDYDPKKLDVLAYIPKAKALAQKLLPDAALVAIDVKGVYPDGHANIALASDYEADFTFRSPAQSKRPADLPANVEAELYCIVNVELYTGGIMVYTSHHDRCSQPGIKPKCTLAEAWQKAIDKGAASNNVVAEITIDRDGWNVEVGDFDETMPDDCP